MTLAFWICSSSLILSVILYFISYIKYNFVVNSIFGALVVPFITAIYIILLQDYIPDSLHLMILGFLALVFYSLSDAFLIFEDKKALYIMSRLSLFISLGLWSYSYHSSFLIYDVADSLIITFIVVFVLLSAGSLFFVEKKTLANLFQNALFLGLSVFILFSASVSLFYEKSVSSTLLFAGSIFILSDTALTIIDKKKRFKHRKFFHTFLSLLSQASISFATILIFAGI